MHNLPRVLLVSGSEQTTHAYFQKLMGNHRGMEVLCIPLWLVFDHVVELKELTLNHSKIIEAPQLCLFTQGLKAGTVQMIITLCKGSEQDQDLEVHGHAEGLGVDLRIVLGLRKENSSLVEVCICSHKGAALV